MARWVLIALCTLLIKWSAAELTCGDSEIEDDCPSICPSDFCPKSESEASVSCPKPDPCPQPACKCRFNYRRENGTCIPTRDCPPFPCKGPNEEFNACPPLCPTDSCSQATPSGKCPTFGRIGITLECKPKCRCVKGYWRDNGVCVPYAECPNIANSTKVESTPETTDDAQQTTLNDSSPSSQSNDAPETETDPSVTSTSANQTELTCGYNEVVDNCPDDCTSSDRCPKSENEALETCLQPNPCPAPACRCAFNHRRADNGTCIPTRNCPPFECSRENEEFNPCPPICPTDECSQASPSGECPRSIGFIDIVLPCNPRCRCKKGYWRTKNGVCVPYADCPLDTAQDDQPSDVTETTSDNGDNVTNDDEDFDTGNLNSDSNNGNSNNNDSTYDSDSSPVTSDAVKDGDSTNNNSCNDNQTNDDLSDGDLNKNYSDEKHSSSSYTHTSSSASSTKATKTKKYSPKRGVCKGKNEEYVEEKQTCPPQTCVSLVVRINNCTNSPPPKPGCACKSGYLRINETSPCIPICDCPQMAGSADC